MAMMTLILTMLTMIAAVHGESILRKNYGSSMETLDAQVHFTTDNGRIVLYYTILQSITVKKFL